MNAVTAAPPRVRTANRRAGRLTVALVGADGAGKSTITEMLEHSALPLPAKRLYMGVNLEASSLMLPTTRLLLAAKRARGRRPDLVANDPLGARDAAAHEGGLHRAGRAAKAGLRMSVWITEEWLRQLAATYYGRRGQIVVFDRHFFADYYHADVARGRTAPSRVHGWMLEHVYPRPGLVICLDAEPEVLYARKPEASQEWLRQRREQYLSLGSVVPDFVVVDAGQPVERVLADVERVIRDYWEATRT